MAAVPGQMYFLLMKSGKLSASIYQELLKTGEYNQGGNHFVLVDAEGHPVKPDGLTLQNSLYVYPGNPGQALIDCKASPEQWQFKEPTAPQTGSGLAVLARELTNKGMDGQAFPLPTRFDGYGAQFEDIYTQEELGLLQLQRLRGLQENGQHVIVPLLPRQGIFEHTEAIVQAAGTPTDLDADWTDILDDEAETLDASEQNYFLAFWGGVVDGPVASNLPTLYAHSLKSLSEFSYDPQHKLIEAKKIVLDELQQYAKIDFNFARGKDSKRVAAMNFFGSFVGHKNEAVAQDLALQVHKAVSIEGIQAVLNGAAQQVQQGGLSNAVVHALSEIQKQINSSESSPPQFSG